MPSLPDTNRPALADHYAQQLTLVSPFATGPSGDIYLLRPAEGTPAEQEEALSHLARSGVLSEYRYCEGHAPAILAVRAA